MDSTTTIRFIFKAFKILFEPPDIIQLITAITGALSRILINFPSSYKPIISLHPTLSK